MHLPGLHCLRLRVVLCVGRFGRECSRLHPSGLSCRTLRKRASCTGIGQEYGHTDCIGCRASSRPFSSCTPVRGVPILPSRETGSMCTPSFPEPVQCCPGPFHLEVHSTRLREDRTVSPCLFLCSSPSVQTPSRCSVGGKTRCHIGRRMDHMASIA